MGTTNRIIAVGSVAALVILGIASIAVIGGGTGEAVAIALIGLGCIVSISLAFLEIGLSEDRDLAREEQARSRASRELRDSHEPRESRQSRERDLRVARRRLDWTRARRRRSH